MIKRMSKGFTLIELMIVIAIIGILGAILAPVIFGGSSSSGGFTMNGNAEQDFRKYIFTIAPEGKPESLGAGPFCKSMDTGGDGNVRCTASIVAPKGYDAQGNPANWERQTIEAECGTYLSSGCGAVKAGRGW